MPSPSQTLQELTVPLYYDPKTGQPSAASDWVHRLPPELLCEIFKKIQHETISSFEFPPCKHDPESAASSLWVPALTSICRTWRQAALSDCSLWQSLTIRSTMIGNGLVAQQFLDRSDPMPFRLSIYDDPLYVRRHGIDFSEFFSSLAKNAYRIESLYLAGWQDFRYTPEGSEFLLNSLPILQNLHLDFYSLWRQAVIFGGPYPVNENHPLKKLSLSYGRPPAALPSTLTHLYLDANPSSHTLNEFLRIIAKLPHLKVLCLGWAGPSLIDEERLELVRLPKLRYIRFRTLLYDDDDYPLVLLYKLITPVIENIIWHGSLTFNHGERSPYSVPPTSYLESVTHLIARAQESFEIQCLASTLFSPLHHLQDFSTDFATKLKNVRHLTIADRHTKIASFREALDSFLSLETFECSLSFMGSLEFKGLEAEDNPFLPDLTELILWVMEGDLKNTVYDPFYDIRNLDISLPQALLQAGYSQRDRRNAKPYVIRLNIGDIHCWKDGDGTYAFGGQDE